MLDRLTIVRGFGALCAAALFGVALVSPVLAADPFDKLVAQSKAEMEKSGGKIAMSLDWPDPDTKQVFPAFMKEFPFVKTITYKRETGIGPFGRFLLSFKQGENPPYDIMHIAGEFQQQYWDAGALIKPLYDYRELSKSLPESWPRIAEESYDPKGNFLATVALVRGNVWNTKLVPKGKEPLTWAACTDPMWKGKVVVDARNKLHAFQYDLDQRPRHLAWLDGLMKNDVTIIDGQGPILQKVASGEYPIACGVNYHSAQRLIDTGVKTLQFSVADVIPLEIGTRMYINKWSTMPATTQLFAVWLATAGQEVLDKTAYRGFPSNPLNRNYEAAKGKHTSVCDADCVAKWDGFNQEYQTKLNIPALPPEGSN
jgi:ABC-type Fe3+ transport system substrate-binding protein